MIFEGEEKKYGALGDYAPETVEKARGAGDSASIVAEGSLTAFRGHAALALSSVNPRWGLGQRPKSLTPRRIPKESRAPFREARRLFFCMNDRS